MILLNFDGNIEGDCTIEKHDKWITCESMQFGVGRAISHSGGGQDRETSNPSLSEVTITKTMDKTSTELFMQATAGKSLGDATIHFVQTGGTDVKGQHYLEYILSEAIVSSYSVSSGGDRPSESISISFTKLKTKYDVFKDGKSVEAGKAKGWDVEKNEAM